MTATTDTFGTSSNNPFSSTAPSSEYGSPAGADGEPTISISLPVTTATSPASATELLRHNLMRGLDRGLDFFRRRWAKEGK